MYLQKLNWCLCDFTKVAEAMLHKFKLIIDKSDEHLIGKGNILNQDLLKPAKVIPIYNKGNAFKITN